jgi:tetratricopeptide (TPR) repeat protein
MQVLFDDEPIPDFPGDAGSQAGRLYQTVTLARLMLHGDYDGVGNRIQELSKSGQTLLCHQLAAFWLQAETDDAAKAYQSLNEWMRASGLTTEYRRSYRILVRQSVELDRRLATRWAPVLRLYLASLLDDWTPEISEQTERDRQTALQQGINMIVLTRLDVMIRLTRARQDQSVEHVLSAVEDWHQICQAQPDFGHGGEFVLDAVIALESANRISEALTWIERALLVLPDEYELLLTKARLLKQTGELEAGLKVCHQIIEHYPDDFSGYCLRSNAWFLLGRYDEAMQDARKACSVAPDNPNSLMARAFINMQLGNYKEALEDFRRTLERDPQTYDARRGEGKCLSMLGRDYDALACFNDLRRTYPDDPDIYYELSDVLFSAGYLEDCEKACRRCLQLDSSYVSAYVILGMIAMRRNEDDLAHGLLTRAVEMEPDNPFALNELAYLTHLEGDDEQALELVNRALAESDDYADAYCNKGMILYYRSEFELAAASFGQTIDLAPDHVSAWIGRGNTLTQLCEFDEAQRCYDRALQLDPASADACHGKALLYRILGLEEEVRRWQEQATLLDPTIEDD